MSPTAIPALPRGVRLHHCKVREGWFLLAPERAVKLNQIGVAILGCVDGARSLEAISAKLADEFGAPVERVSGDVAKFLKDLQGRGMVDLT